MTSCEATSRTPLSFTKQQQKLQPKAKWSFSFVINVEWLLNRQHAKIQLS